MTDLTTKLDEWQRIAEGAPEGPWFLDLAGVHNTRVHIANVTSPSTVPSPVATHVATFDPSTILRMLAVIRAAQEHVDGPGNDHAIMEALAALTEEKP